MTILYVLIPLALLLGAGAVVAFVWAVDSGQLDDMDTPPLRMLGDEDKAPERVERGTKSAHPSP